MRKSIFAAVCGILVLCVVLSSGCAGDKSLQGINGKQARDMNSARTQFEQSEDPPLTAETHFAAGQLNETQGSIPAAIGQYEAALALKPNFSPALYQLGCLYSQIKQYPQAIEAWNRYIAATNNSGVGYSNLGFCQELSGDRKAAEENYLTGIERDPGNQLCRVNYGLMLTRQGRVDEAREQFGAVLPDAQVHYNIASVLQQQGKKDAARAEYKEAIKTDPKFWDAQTRLADLDKN